MWIVLVWGALWIRNRKNKPWFRFVFTTTYGIIKAPWAPLDQEKIDSMFEIFDELSTDGVNYLETTDSKGNEYIIPGPIAQTTMVRIEMRMRFF